MWVCSESRTVKNRPSGRFFLGRWAPQRGGPQGFYLLEFFLDFTLPSWIFLSLESSWILLEFWNSPSLGISITYLHRQALIGCHKNWEICSYLPAGSGLMNKVPPAGGPADEKWRKKLETMSWARGVFVVLRKSKKVSKLSKIFN